MKQYYKTSLSCKIGIYHINFKNRKRKTFKKEKSSLKLQILKEPHY